MDLNLLLTSFLILDWAVIATAGAGLLGIVGIRTGRHHDALVRMRLSR